jgi:hypothetical protein
MDNPRDRQPTKQEMQARMKEMVTDIRRSVAATPVPPKLSARAPRETLPMVTEPRRGDS